MALVEETHAPAQALSTVQAGAGGFAGFLTFEAGGLRILGECQLRDVKRKPGPANSLRNRGTPRGLQSTRLSPKTVLRKMHLL